MAGRRVDQYAATDGCQYGMELKSLSDGSFGQSVKKGQVWLSNFCLSEFSLGCGHPDALGRVDHPRRHVRGTTPPCIGPTPAPDKATVPSINSSRTLLYRIYALPILSAIFAPTQIHQSNGVKINTEWRNKGDLIPFWFRNKRI